MGYVELNSVYVYWHPSFLQRETTSAHCHCFLVIAEHESKMRNVRRLVHVVATLPLYWSSPEDTKWWRTTWLQILLRRGFSPSYLMIIRVLLNGWMLKALIKMESIERQFWQALVLLLKNLNISCLEHALSFPKHYCLSEIEKNIGEKIGQKLSHF
jgi:hypothetical protein